MIGFNIQGKSMMIHLIRIILRGEDKKLPEETLGIMDEEGAPTSPSRTFT
jgi:hypothetical protein